MSVFQILDEPPAVGARRVFAVRRDDVIDQTHDRIYRNLVRLLEGRNRAELCQKAGIPDSTLSQQMKKGRFTIELLAPLAKVLGTTIGALADPPPEELSPARAQQFVRDLEELLERARRTGR